MFAVMNTVDSIPRFARRGVYVFSSQAQAKVFMVKWAKFGLKYTRELNSFGSMDDAEIIEEFQNDLEQIEYFHLEKVVGHNTQIAK